MEYGRTDRLLEIISSESIEGECILYRLKGWLYHLSSVDEKVNFLQAYFPKTILKGYRVP